tara:strand:+ start:90 stop:926 length:837 start_codon:yes stop_codon:yes gene_type:complete
MKKIIWITSYPKSGNTWMRFLLANYFFNKEKIFNYDIIDYIKKFTTEIAFSHNDKSPKNLNEISKKWSLIQKNWEVINGDVVFLKNHNANIEVNGNQFLEELSALAIIHIVRDPRDLIISGSNFWKKSYDWVINKICNENLNLMFGSEKQNYNDLEVHGSWKLNFNSWNNTKLKIPYILIRYEDLIENCEKEFKSVIIFLSKILGFVPNMDQLKFAIENSKFDDLSNSEKKYGFKEISNGQTFFNSGKRGQWKNTLSSDQISLIENYNYKEMKMLKYL